MTAAARVAGLVPDAAFARLIAVAHRRFERELGIVAHCYPGGGTVLDIGAWYGPWTYWLSRRAERVIAFEPNADVARVLRATARPNVTVIEAAVSDHEGLAQLTLPAGGRGTEGRASLTEHALDGRGDTGRVTEVRTVRIDDLNLHGVRLVKIDVEGHEIPALDGMTGLLERDHPVLVVELEERFGGLVEAVARFDALGYRGQVLVRNAWIALDDFDLVGHQRMHAEDEVHGYLRVAVRGSQDYVNNVVFVHPQSGWTVR